MCTRVCVCACVRMCVLVVGGGIPGEEEDLRTERKGVGAGKIGRGSEGE